MPATGTVRYSPGTVQTSAAVAHGSASTSEPAVGAMNTCAGFELFTVYVTAVATTDSTIAVYLSGDGTNVAEATDYRTKFTADGFLEVPCQGAKHVLAQLYAVTGTGTTTFHGTGS